MLEGNPMRITRNSSISGDELAWVFLSLRILPGGYVD